MIKKKCKNCKLGEKMNTACEVHLRACGTAESCMRYTPKEQPEWNKETIAESIAEMTAEPTDQQADAQERLEESSESPDCEKCHTTLFCEDGLEHGEPPFYCHVCEIEVLKEQKSQALSIIEHLQTVGEGRGEEAKLIIDGIWKDLDGRRGFHLHNLDGDIKRDIKRSWRKIIKEVNPK